VEMETEKGDWYGQTLYHLYQPSSRGFKALKQSTKLSYQKGRLQQVLVEDVACTTILIFRLSDFMIDYSSTLLPLPKITWKRVSTISSTLSRPARICHSWTTFIRQRLRHFKISTMRYDVTLMNIYTII
jgi:hypothetical protein